MPPSGLNESWGSSRSPLLILFFCDSMKSHPGKNDFHHLFGMTYVESLSLEIFKTQLEKVLSNLM